MPTNPQLQTLRLYAELISRRETLAGTLTFAHGPGCSATGLPAAVSIAGGTTLLLDPDTATVKTVFRTGGLDFVVNTLDEAVRVLKNEVRKHTPLSVALTADPVTILAEMQERGIQPDLEVAIGNTNVTDLALATLHLATADGLIQPTGHALAWLATRDWSEIWLTTETTADLRALDARLILQLTDPSRQQWLRRISHYQRPAPNTGRAIWLTPSERQGNRLRDGGTLI
jgi:urocanate hydratase